MEFIYVKRSIGLKCSKTGGAVEVCASQTVGGQVESTTGGATATISAVGCNAQHHLHAHKTDDLGEHEGDLLQPDTSGKPPLTPPKALGLNLTS